MKFTHKQKIIVGTLASLFTSLALAASSGLNTLYLDKQVRPQDDLYRAANGVWLKNTSIPANKTEVYGVEVPELMTQRIQKIVQNMAEKKQEFGSNAQKIGSYYTAYNDTTSIDMKGDKVLQNAIQEIAKIKTISQLAQWQGRMQGIIKTPVWLWGGFADFSDPTLNRAMGMQGGLGLPDRDYYLKLDDKRFASARSAYLVYLTTLAKLLKEKDPALMAQRVFDLETKLAQAHTPQQEAMNPGAVQTLTVEQLSAKAPGFDWAAFLAAAKIPADNSINYMQASTVMATAKLYQEISIEDWKAYSKLRLVSASASVLPKAYRDANFAFYGNALGGMKEAEARDRQGINQVSEMLSEALSRSYVEQYFPKDHKQRIQKMVDALLVAARETVSEITWMAPETKQEALAKLQGYKAKIGFPQQWRDYTKLIVRDADAFGNQQRAKRFEWERQAALSGTKVDRGLWMMAPIEVNAYYDPVLNEINLPAAFLQKPFFDIDADDASNFGALGANIAHEISHGFDPNGAQFDSKGQLRNWWSEQDRLAFKAKQMQLSTFYSQFEVIKGKHVNGEQTLPENIADILGIQIAFRAYKNTLAQQPSQIIDGMTGEQRFFYANAQTWAVQRRDERVVQLLATDPHAPNELRSNVVAMNTDAFHEVFATKPGDKLYLAPEQRFRIK